MSVTTAPRVRSNVSTSQMTSVELARVFADHFGWTANAGGWISERSGTAIVQGWESLAELLTVRGWIGAGKGVALPLFHGKPVAPIIRRAVVAQRAAIRRTR